jgi:hypothetical protein
LHRSVAAISVSVRPLRSVLTYRHSDGPNARRNHAFRAGDLWRAHCAAQVEERGEMSQKTVQLVIGRLLTDEDLRACFVERPRETLSDLCEKGFDLTEDEIDALARSDAKMWAAMAKRIHPRLQRCSLRSR